MNHNRILAVSTLVFGLACLSILLPSAHHNVVKAQQPTPTPSWTTCPEGAPEGVYLFTSSYFGRPCVYTTSSISDVVATGLTNGVQSVCVIPTGGWFVRFYEELNFRGRDKPAGQPCDQDLVRSFGWAPKSVQIERMEAATPPSIATPTPFWQSCPDDAREGVYLYSKTYFGRSSPCVFVRQSVPDLMAILPEGLGSICPIDEDQWEIYLFDQVDFGGHWYLLERCEPDVASKVPWHGSVKSAMIHENLSPPPIGTHVATPTRGAPTYRLFLPYAQDREEWPPIIPR